MAKSSIIKQLIAEEISLTQALDRLYVIAYELEDDYVLEWIKNEKNGYFGDKVIVPSYRHTKAYPIGNYRIGNLLYERKLLPTIGVSDKQKKMFDNWEEKESVATLLEMKKNMSEGKIAGIPVPPEVFYMFEEGTNINVVSAYIVVSDSNIENIITAIKDRILNMLLLLEKNFGSLDNLDIDTSNYNKEELSCLKEQAKTIIVENQTIKNKVIIKHSNIGENNRIEKELNVNTDVTVNSEKKKGFFSKLLSIFKKK